jgi:hypothetical protein
VSSILTVVFFTEGVLAANTAREWRSLISDEAILDRLGVDTMLNIRDSLAATGVSWSYITIDRGVEIGGP